MLLLYLPRCCYHYRFYTALSGYSNKLVSNKSQSLKIPATRVDWKQSLRRTLKRNPWEYLRRSSCFSKVAGYRPSTFLKMNLFKVIVQAFYQDLYNISGDFWEIKFLHDRTPLIGGIRLIPIEGLTPIGDLIFWIYNCIT